MGHPVVHFEIIGTDGKRLQDYYSELFDWEIDADNDMSYGVVPREGNVTGKGSASAVACARRARRLRRACDVLR